MSESLTARVVLPGDRPPGMPADYSPSEHGMPPVPAIMGTAVDTALLLLEGRRWWLAEYHGDHSMRDAEVDAIEAAIASLKRALACQRGCCR